MVQRRTISILRHEIDRLSNAPLHGAFFFACYPYLMDTRISFSIDKKLKAAAIRKAKKIRLSLATVLNEAARAFVEDDMQIGFYNPAMIDDIARAREDIRYGRMLSHDDVVEELRVIDA